MKNIEYLDRLFPKPPLHTHEEEKILVKSMVKKYATGNVSLSSGRYTTTEDVEKRRKAIISHTF